MWGKGGAKVTEGRVILPQQSNSEAPRLFPPKHDLGLLPPAHLDRLVNLLTNSSISKLERDLTC